VSSILQDIDGVREVKTDLANHKVSVTYEAATTGPRAMTRALKNAGFSVGGHRIVK
jgi:copper chaperone CopZ